MHVDLIRNKRRRVGVLTTVAVLALSPTAALAAPSKPKPASTYMTYTLSEVQIS